MFQNRAFPEQAQCILEPETFESVSKVSSERPRASPERPQSVSRSSLDLKEIMSRGFLKPNIDDDVFKEDKVDIDTQKNTSFIFNPVPSWSLNAQRTRLPIAKNKNDILYLLEQNQVLVIVGDTGCGKSTQIPQYLAEAGWTDSNTMIGM